ncbi:hypothetical protein HYX10_02075 [Candidatus Woesearchaeota archaeon]|nr:hypothetical protein [Candidatus Woesearchaeota archaeon]
MKQLLPSVFVVWLLVFAQVSYGQSLSAASSITEVEPGVNSGDEISVQDDSCSSAVELALGNWDSFNNINPSGDVDWYKWNLVSGGKFTVDVDVPSNKDYDVKVYKTCGGSVICSSAKGRGLDEKCSADVSSGWVYAMVYGYQGDSGFLELYSIRGTFSPNADLVPAPITTSPSNPIETDSVTIRYGSTNIGASDIITAYTSKFYIDNNLVQTCTSSNGKPAGASGFCTYTSKLSDGTRALKVIVDADRQVPESNEGNNEKTSSLKILPDIDLRVVDIYTEPSSPDDRNSFNLRVVVRNDGKIFFSNFNTRVYLNGQYFGDCTHILPMFGNSEETCKWDNLRWSANTYTVRAVADSNSEIEEKNENNNEREETVTVTHENQYDLIVTEILTEPSSVNDQTTFSIKHLIKNNGPDRISSHTVSKLYRNNELIHICSHSAGFDSGETRICTLQNQRWSSGTYEVKAVADADSEISETDEGNNQRKEEFRVDESCVDNDGDGYGTGCSKGSDCNDNDRNINPGQGEICGDGLDNNCNGQQNENCCSPEKPYYCTRTDGCWLNKERCDTAIMCGGRWWACNEPSKYNIKCVNDEPGCCLPQHPYYCPENNFCFGADGYCDGRPVYNCNGKYQVCSEKNYYGTCFGDVLRCCPSGESWWESDKQCHKSSEPPKCAVPDGSSANCDCDTDSECKAADASRPYCGEGGSLYDVRTPQGFHACLATKPKYCGDGICEGSETFSSCNKDCAQNAPKGKITVSVTHSQAKLPIKYAGIYVDGSLSGGTDQFGKAVVEVPYGVRHVRVNCFSGSFCGEQTRDVKKEQEFMSFSCECSDGDLDSDGFSDQDEILIGSDPHDAKSYPEGLTYNPVKCIADTINILVVWLRGGDLIQAHTAVVQTLSSPEVSSVAASEQSAVILQALQQNYPDARLDVQSGITIQNAVERAEYIDAVLTRDGLLYVISDNETQTTAIVQMQASCVGTIVGAAYGVGRGIEDDISILELPVIAVKGLLFVVANADELSKVYDGFLEMVDGFMEVIKNFDFAETRYHLIKFIFEEGRKTNPYREDKQNDRHAYYHYQLGFFSGYVTGYIIEQVVFLKVAFAAVKTAFKASGKLLSRLSGGENVLELLAAITKHPALGIEIAKKVSNLPYVKGAVQLWANDELILLGKLTKYNENFVKTLTKAEAQNVLKLTKNIPDASLEKLVTSKLGQHTLKAADATDGLIAKQAKLVERWGVKNADDVVTKCTLFIFCNTDRIKDLNKLLKAAPDEFANKLKVENAHGLLSYKHLDELTEALTELKSVKGFDDVAGPLANQNTWTGPAFQLRKGLQLRKAGNTVVEFERGTGSTFIDIVYKKPNSAVEIYMETKNTVSIDPNFLVSLKNQLTKYYAETGDWDRVRLSSGNGIPPEVRKELVNEFGESAVEKILKGDI